MILVVLVLRSSNSGSSGSTSSTTISSITTWGPYHGGGAVDTQHETIYIYSLTLVRKKPHFQETAACLEQVLLVILAQARKVVIYLCHYM